jgi:polysaccharide deacetylase family protein (PEP-CTERM system associated)
VQHLFTVDVEDWFDGIPVSREFRRTAERRLERGLIPLLDILDRYKATGLFFWLGPTAAAYPDLLRETVRRGHTIGCHGWSHDFVSRMSPEVFREETLRAKCVIEEIASVEVTAYRAAYFSIDANSMWALDELSTLGFTHDFSIMPVRNWRYGIPGFPPTPQRIQTVAGSIVEVPISVRPVLGQNIPVSGGAYFRLYPYPVTRSNFRWMQKRNRPAVFYIHPPELDVDKPRVKLDPRLAFTHYTNLATTAPKLHRLLSDFRFNADEALALLSADSQLFTLHTYEKNVE